MPYLPDEELMEFVGSDLIQSDILKQVYFMPTWVFLSLSSRQPPHISLAVVAAPVQLPLTLA